MQNFNDLQSHYLGKSDELSSVNAEPRVAASDYVTEYVDFSTSSIFDEIADVLADDASWVARAELNAGDEYISNADMKRYLRTLVFMRVAHVNNELKREFRSISKQLFVPNFFSIILTAIGKVDDKENGVVLLPTYQHELKEAATLFMTEKEMLAMSAKIGRITDDGFKAVKHWDNNVDGVLDFMALTIVESTVKSYRRGSKSYAIFAALFSRMALQQATGLNYRITYGKTSQYQLDLSALTGH